MFILGNNVRLMLVTHSCFREECRLTCPLDGAKFAQEARESSADMKCDMNAEQQYSFGRCNMKCLSSVMPGVCRQVRNFGICEFMTFNATQSIQISHDAKCVITCPLGAKNCAQFGYVLLPGRITMKYDLPQGSINFYKGGEFQISHDASLHAILSSFRTHVILSVQQARDATVEQRWTATCFCR